MLPSHHPCQTTVPLPPHDGDDQGSQHERFRDQRGWDPKSVVTATLDLEHNAPGTEQAIATFSPVASSHLAPQSAFDNFGTFQRIVQAVAR